MTMTATEQKLVKVKFSDIRLNEDGLINCRNDEEARDVDDLVESIKLFGLQSNLGVWQPPGKNYQVLCTGFRRYHALKKLREEDSTLFHTILVNLIEGNLEHVLQVNIEENERRKKICIIDKAKHIWYLRKRGMTTTDIGKKLQMSQGRVSVLCSIEAGCIKPVLTALKSSLITGKEAEKIAGLSKEEQMAVLEKLLEERKTGKKSSAVDKILAEMQGKSVRPSLKIMKGKVKQIEAHDSKLDKEYRFGVNIGLRYALGMLLSEEDLYHPPTSLQPIEVNAPSTKKKSFAAKKSQSVHSPGLKKSSSTKKV